MLLTEYIPAKTGDFPQFAKLCVTNFFLMFWHTIMTYDHLVGNLWQGMYGHGSDKTH